MKKSIVLSILTATLFLAGCASDDVSADSASPDSTPRSFLQSGDEGGADLDIPPPVATPAPFTRPLQQ